MKTSRRLVASALSLGLGLSLWGCSTDIPGETPNPAFVPDTSPAVGLVGPKFDPTAGNPAEIPLPNDLLRNPGPGPNQGLVDQIPNTPPFDAEPFTSLKSMRGFSTAGNILIPFDGQINAGTVTDQTVLLIEGAPSNDADEVDFTNTTIACNLQVTNPEGSGNAGNSTIVMQPIKPLRPFRNYFVILTSSIQAKGRGIRSPRTAGSPSLDTGKLTKFPTPLIDGNGNSLVFPVPDASAAQLEPLRQFYQPVWSRVERITGQSREGIPFAFRFGTQPLFAALPTTRAQAAADNRGLTPGAVIAPNAAAVDAFYAGLPAPANLAPRANIARIITGAMLCRNYISNSTPGRFQSLTGFFQGTGFPGDPITTPAGQENVPANFLALFPAGAGPFPVVIFQHGITRTKNDVLVVADSLCQAGFAVIAIDLPMHGDNNLPNPATPGQGFVNLASLRTARDNLRQSAVNLQYLTHAIVSGQTNIDGVAGPEFSPAPPGFLGQSLGGIVGGLYTATDPSSRRAVLNVAGGRISNLVLDSSNVSPQVLGGLAQQGIVPGSDSFAQFFLIAQTVVDDGDPFNYASPSLVGALKGGAANASAVLLQEAVGDTVVPNSASRDLANSFSSAGMRHVQPIVNALPLLQSVAAPFAGSGYFQFPNTAHGVLLTPADGNTAAVRFQAITFLATGSVNNPFLVFPKADADQQGGGNFFENLGKIVHF